MSKIILLTVLVILLIYMLIIAPMLASDSSNESSAEHYTNMNLSGFDPTNPSVGFNHPINERSVKHGSLDSINNVVQDTIDNTVQMSSSHKPVGLLNRDPTPLKIKDDAGRSNIRDFNMAARRYNTKAPQKAINISEPTLEEKLVADQKADCKAINGNKCGLQMEENVNITETANVPKSEIENMIPTSVINKIDTNLGIPSPAAIIKPQIKEVPITKEELKPKSTGCNTCDHSYSPSFNIPKRAPPERPETILRLNRPMLDEYSRQLLESGNVRSLGNDDMKRVDFVEFYNNVSQIANAHLMNNKPISTSEESSSDLSSDLSTDMSSDVSSDISSDVSSDASSNVSSDVSSVQSSDASTKSSDEMCDIASKCSADKCGSESLHPILDPRFNLREVAKQALLLEDHINNTKKRCFDCIRKHFLVVDGLLEEAVSLEPDVKNRAAYRALYMKWLELEKMYASNPLNSDNLDLISQQVRFFRKPLVEKYFDLVKDYELS